jgi:3-isopropylmalate dehydratase small subunit
LASLPADQPVTIDLPQQTVTFAGQTAQFEINAFWKDRLVKGIDDIEATETFDSAIKKFEQRRVEE